MDETGTPPSERPEGAWPTPASPPQFPPPPGDTPPAFPPATTTESFGYGPPQRPRRTLLAAILAAVLLVTGGVGIGWFVTRGGGTTSATRTEAPLTNQPKANSPELSLQAIAAKVDPAVVDVNTVIGAIGGRTGSKGAGTGMVVTASGEVLTNNHVIAGATSITVTVQGRGSYPATVIGADPTDDVALIQIQGVSGLPTVSLGDSSRLSVGQRVAAIGNALGRGGTPAITEGTITALDRSITVGDDNGGSESLSNLIESNAQISPGDSGGALVTGQGQVIGMITAGTASSRFQRVSETSYAIPVNDALDIVNQIRAGHESPNIIIGPAGFLGVEVRALTPADISELGVSSGVFVIGVLPGTPADQAGISGGSVITAINGTKVADQSELGPAIWRHKPGDRIQVTWVDNGGTHTATVTLISGPAV